MKKLYLLLVILIIIIIAVVTAIVAYLTSYIPPYPHNPPVYYVANSASTANSSILLDLTSPDYYLSCVSTILISPDQNVSAILGNSASRLLGEYPVIFSKLLPEHRYTLYLHAESSSCSKPQPLLSFPLFGGICLDPRIDVSWAEDVITGKNGSKVILNITIPPFSNMEHTSYYPVNYNPYTFCEGMGWTTTINFTISYFNVSSHLYSFNSVGETQTITVTAPNNTGIDFILNSTKYFSLSSFSCAITRVTTTPNTGSCSVNVTYVGPAQAKHAMSSIYITGVEGNVTLEYNASS